MEMAVNNVVTTQMQEVYQTYQKSEPKKAEEKEAKNSNAAVVYEKSDADSGKKATYSINQMSAQDREGIVKQLKADAENRQKSLMDLVQNMMTGQAKTATIASGIGKNDDSIWKFIASGKYEVDEETQRQAQEDISEDGYWGVKQTSQRLFDFASALAGDDVDTMKKMQSFMMKGYKEAQKAWGGELPEITQKTMDAADKLFDDYYKSKEVV